MHTDANTTPGTRVRRVVDGALGTVQSVQAYSVNDDGHDDGAVAVLLDQDGQVWSGTHVAWEVVQSSADVLASAITDALQASFRDGLGTLARYLTQDERDARTAAKDEAHVRLWNLFYDFIEDQGPRWSKFVHDHPSTEGCDTSGCRTERYIDGDHVFTDKTIEARPEPEVELVKAQVATAHMFSVERVVAALGGCIISKRPTEGACGYTDITIEKG